LHHSSGDSAYPLIREVIKIKKGINTIVGNKTNAEDDQEQTEN
jgi:hypothetical protein